MTKAQCSKEQWLLQRVEYRGSFGSQSVNETGAAPVAGARAVTKPRCLECRKFAPVAALPYPQSFFGKCLHDNARTVRFGKVSQSKAVVRIFENVTNVHCLTELALVADR